MALFDDIIQGLGGVAQVASGIGTLQQPGVEVQRRTPPPSPSSAELTNLQLQHALTLANLQAAGFDVTRGAGGEMTLTPRTTPSDVLQQQLGGAGAGLQRELANLGPQTSALGSQLNTQALAGARGQPQINRAALIQAIQQRRGPAAGLGLQAPGPTPITTGPLSTETPFSNVPSLGALSRQQGGTSPFLTQTLPGILGGATVGLGLLNKLFPQAIPSVGRGISNLFGGAPDFNISDQELRALENAGLQDEFSSGDFFFIPEEQFTGGFDFESSIPSFDLGSDTFTNFADQGFGIDLNP